MQARRVQLLAGALIVVGSVAVKSAAAGSAADWSHGIGFVTGEPLGGAAVARSLGARSGLCGPSPGALDSALPTSSAGRQISEAFALLSPW